MKMSEVFNMPVDVPIWDKMVIHDNLSNYIAVEFEGDCAKAAAHAINCHDELVAALELMLTPYSAGTPLLTRNELQGAKAALSKARGES